MPYTVQPYCRACTDFARDDPLTHKILSLGQTPLADRFPTSPTAPEETYPLDVYVCLRCHLVQLGANVDDKELFGGDYGFYTGASPSSQGYFADYAAEMIQRFPDLSQNVLEIASNDGTLLGHFKKSGARILGVDPAVNVAQEANAAGITTLAKEFNFHIAQNHLQPVYGKFDLILANNVVAHVTNLCDFFGGVEEILSLEGVFVVEVQYLPHLLFQNAFDHVYHEHRSFFSLMSFSAALSLYTSFRIFDVQEADTQGGSIRLYIDRGHRPVAQSVADMQDSERRLGLDRLETYQGFQSRVDYIRDKLVALLTKLKDQGKTICGFGASAKGNTLLNYCGIGPDLLDCVVDLTPYKIGKYTPGSHIPVKSQDQLERQPDYYLVLVWNYLEGILRREKAYRDAGGRFIVPIPAPIVI